MTKQEIRKEWVRRLQSGSIVQTTSILGKSDGSRCCLGVLCDIAVDEGVIGPPTKKVISYDTTELLKYDGAVSVLPMSVQDWVGLRASTGRWADAGKSSLSNRNDSGCTFKEIASIIESEPEGLFVKEA